MFTSNHELMNLHMTIDMKQYFIVKSVKNISIFLTNAYHFAVEDTDSSTGFTWITDMFFVCGF